MCRSLMLEMKIRRLRIFKGLNALVAATALLLLAGFDGCPLSLDNTPPAQLDGGNTSSTLDIGGSGGAYWNVTYAKEVVITVRTSSEVAVKQVSANSGTISLLSSTINIGTFCLRADTLCPAALLPTNTLIIQPSNAPWNPVISYNRYGPLRILKNHTGLIGVLTSDTLKVPLATNGLAAAKGDYCALVPPSGIDARAMATSGTGQKADTLQGKITMAYVADCWNLGGGSAVTPGAIVELTVAFTGERKLGI